MADTLPEFIVLLHVGNLIYNVLIFSGQVYDHTLDVTCQNILLVIYRFKMVASFQGGQHVRYKQLHFWPKWIYVVNCVDQSNKTHISKSSWLVPNYISTKGYADVMLLAIENKHLSVFIAAFVP